MNRTREVIFDEWIKTGIEQGFCGPPVCALHDGVPTTLMEDEGLWEGDEHCHHVVRMYTDAKQKAQVEVNHHPSTWRNEWTPKLRLVDMPELNGTDD
tara:strand:+ start:384 stop:674 length:291 start_codon:yes stop_codon:yes gene_type:complete